MDEYGITGRDLKRPLAELTRVSFGGVAPLVLHFRDGSRMRVFGIPVWERARLLDTLNRLAPQLENDL